MPSPFPGMDPYHEDPAHWCGVHAALIVGRYDSLNATLPEGFVARIEEPQTAIFDRLYDAGPFRRSLDYRRDPIPPLSEDDARWANSLEKQ